MKANLHLSALTFFLTFVGFSQQNSLHVISSIGGMDSAQSISLEWTVGESLVETLNDGKTVFTQGFQQTFFTTTPMKEVPSGTLIRIFPNPTNSYFYVLVETGNKDILNFLLYDIHGRVLYTKTVLPHNEILFDVSAFASGIYLLDIRSSSGAIIESQKIIKH
jgi:hypothetical protein